ncbi:flagellin [Gayadomonas joobiniege]|uniref:flagellin N-terminal helical domain-containing protein n=1 Tax=Gayadomonas joobiniege TaxID=1234606 RepID=UPI000374FA3B|nr:flagellin [Gayadomonas joobiniege]
MNINGVSSTQTLFEQIQQKQDSNAEKLASGKKVNSAADAAAAQQIIERLTAESNAYQQSVRNAYDGISLAQTADGALQGVTEDTQRIRELTLQAGNGILNDADRQAIQSEITALQENIQSTLENTEFNGQSLFDREQSFVFQVGSDAGQTQSLDISDLSSSLSDIQNINVTSGNIEDSLDALDSAAELIAAERANYGATQNALGSTINNLNTADINQQAARSRLQDADYASLTAQQAANQVQQQSALSITAQANQYQEQALSLLS